MRTLPVFRGCPVPVQELVGHVRLERPFVRRRCALPCCSCRSRRNQDTRRSRMRSVCRRGTRSGSPTPAEKSVSCRGSPPRAGRSQACAPFFRVETNRSDVPSGDQRGWVSAAGFWVMRRKPVPSVGSDRSRCWSFPLRDRFPVRRMRSGSRRVRTADLRSAFNR